MNEIVKFFYKNKEIDSKQAYKILSDGRKVDTEFNFSDNTSNISQDSIKGGFEEIKKELKEKGYKVDNINFPKITGFLIPEKEYDSLIKDLFYVGKEDTEEYGITFNPDNQKSSASIKDISGKGTNWFIFICQNRGDIAFELAHELLHVFEFFLELKDGTLTKEFNLYHKQSTP